MKAGLSVYILLVVINFKLILAQGEDEANDLHKLRADIFQKSGYDKWSRPVKSHFTVTTVKLEIVLTRIIDLESLSDLLTTEGWLRMKWTDEHLTWDPNGYHNLSRLQVPFSDIWTPDIVLYNAAQDLITTLSHPMAIVESNGEVSWSPTGTFRSFCPMDLTNYPKDHQECVFMFGSWSHHMREIDLVPHSEETFLRQGPMYTSPKWSLSGNFSFRQETHYGNQSFVAVSLKLRLSRTAAHLDFTHKYPTLAAILCSLLIFWLPPKCFLHRLILMCISMAITSMVMVSVTSELGYHRSVYLVRYLSLVLLMTALSSVSSLVVYLLACRSYASALPIRLASTVNGPLGKVLFLEFTGLTYDLKKEMEERGQGSGPLCVVLQEEWVLFAVLFDRLLFISYLAVFASFSP